MRFLVVDMTSDKPVEILNLQRALQFLEVEEKEEIQRLEKLDYRVDDELNEISEKKFGTITHSIGVRPKFSFIEIDVMKGLLTEVKTICDKTVIIFNDEKEGQKLQQYLIFEETLYKYIGELVDKDSYIFRELKEVTNESMKKYLLEEYLSANQLAIESDQNGNSYFEIYEEV